MGTSSAGAVAGIHGRGTRLASSAGGNRHVEDERRESAVQTVQRELDELDSPSVRVEAGVAEMVPAALELEPVQPSPGEIATSESKIGISGAGEPTGSSGAGSSRLLTLPHWHPAPPQQMARNSQAAPTDGCIAVHAGHEGTAWPM